MVKRITVLLPVYNGERWLPSLLESLRAQTEPDFDVLIQDDGSSDGTPALLEALGPDARFRFGAESGQRLGAKGNFLSLMRQADAPAVALCDQDDVWLPERLALGRKALEEAERRLGTDTPVLVHGDCAVTDAEGSILHASFFRHQGWDPAANTLPRLLVQNNVTGCTVLMNAALCRLAAAHADPARIFMHDWFLALTAAAFGEIVFLPRPLVRYRQHGGNAVGASPAGLPRRALAALRDREKARARIALTYEQAAVFREAYGGALPAEAARIVDGYLAIRSLPKPARIRALRKGGYLMQSRTARMGQLLFG